MELLKQRTLLIVDDEPDILEILIECLTPLHLHIFKAHNGREACEILQNNEIHAVLSDIAMPVMTGIQLLTSVRVVTRALEIGIRNRQILDLATKGASGQDNVSRIFELKHQTRMVGLLTSKHNRERKKKRT